MINLQSVKHLDLVVNKIAEPGNIGHISSQ